VSTFSSPADNTVAGSVIAAVSTAAGALEARGAVADGIVMNTADYWRARRQGADTAGFWIDPAAPANRDLYRPMVYPVLVGGGIPFFPQRERRVDLELVETQTFNSTVVFLRYRVARQPAPPPSPTIENRRNVLAPSITVRAGDPHGDLSRPDRNEQCLTCRSCRALC
jgi:hypothetical protein